MSSDNRKSGRAKHCEASQIAASNLPRDQTIIGRSRRGRRNAKGRSSHRDALTMKTRLLAGRTTFLMHKYLYN